MIIIVFDTNLDEKSIKKVNKALNSLIFDPGPHPCPYMGIKSTNSLVTYAR